jgi:hypothetical protein
MSSLLLPVAVLAALRSACVGFSGSRSVVPSVLPVCCAAVPSSSAVLVGCAGGVLRRVLWAWWFCGSVGGVRPVPSVTWRHSLLLPVWRVSCGSVAFVVLAFCWWLWFVGFPGAGDRAGCALFCLLSCGCALWLGVCAVGRWLVPVRARGRSAFLILIGFVL